MIPAKGIPAKDIPQGKEPAPAEKPKRTRKTDKVPTPEV
jgi:hypothetical protein